MTSRITIHAPFPGWLAGLGEVPDPVFAQKMMGDGVALDPLDGVVCAPCDGEVIALAPTGHSVTLRLLGGAELLIHIGIDTVNMGGEGFAAKVVLGQQVTTGEALILFDMDRVAGAARSLITPIIVANDGFRLEVARLDRRVETGAPLFEVVAETVADSVSGTSPTASQPATSREVAVGLKHGIHARPAARIAAALKPLSAEVTIMAHGRTANARSPVALLGLNTKHGDRLRLTANGTDATAALEAVTSLVCQADPDAADSLPPPAAPTGGAVCASPGIAVGTIAQFRVAQTEVPRDGNGPDFERAALEAALRKAQARLGAGSIAQAHRALLEDPELFQIALRGIEKCHSAAFAWQTATKYYSEMLAGTGDARMIERIDDLSDICAQVLSELGFALTMTDVPEGAILVAEELVPSQFTTLHGTHNLAGICLARGGPTSHVAVLATAAGVPMIVAAGSAVLSANDGATAILDATAASINLAPSAPQIASAQAEMTARAARKRKWQAIAQTDCHTSDGTRIEIFGNLASTAEAVQAVAAGAEGCGLLRTEFLFLDRATAPSEEEQRASYQQIAEALAPRPLIIRTMDVGGDKPLPYLPMGPEENPALGGRGIRMGLARPDLLATQLAGILAVRPLGQCRIMLPMIVDLGELRSVRKALETAKREAGITQPVELGIMIETPAAAMLADQLAGEADFFSIGTNDLTQYTLAADRGNPATAAMIDALHPAVLRMIARTTAGAAKHKRQVGVCGSAAGDPVAAVVLIGLGVTELSVAPSLVPNIKALVASLSLDDMQAVAELALDCVSAAEVRALVTQKLGQHLREVM